MVKVLFISIVLFSVVLFCNLELFSNLKTKIYELLQRRVTKLILTHQYKTIAFTVNRLVISCGKPNFVHLSDLYPQLH